MSLFFARFDRERFARVVRREVELVESIEEGAEELGELLAESPAGTEDEVSEVVKEVELVVV